MNCRMELEVKMQGMKLACRFTMSVVAAATFALSAPAQATCHTCGTVVSLHTYEQPAAHGSGVGAVGGAVVGGLLGNQIGGGNGRTLATVAGAVGGGFAGNAIEKRVRTTTVTRVQVRMNTGGTRNFTEAGTSRWTNGARVRVVRGRLIAA
jgi:outer membrane lipoprotein SlyB